MKKKAKIIIVGTGFGGLASAIRLKQEGEHDFIMLERADEVGGVWRDNSYPGCACDVESHLYSFSFAPNPNWNHKFAKQEEIQNYLKHTAKEFDIMPHIHFDHEVSRLDWHESTGEWSINTSEGIFYSQFAIGAFGALSDPAIPNIKGLEDFKGKVFHSANWPKDFDSKGKNVAIVGTGASAIQFIPSTQPDVNSMHVFQRTPAWVAPRNDGPISPLKKKLYRLFNPLQKLTRFKFYGAREILVIGLRNPKYMKIVKKQALKHMESAISDPDLLKKVTPDYTIGCKRILLSDDYYPALAQDNVEVITSGLNEVKENSVISADNKEREVDTIIFGTGFRVQDPPLTYHTYGKKGRTLAATWDGSPKAYVGTTVTDFPNLFILQGPNTGIGHSSVILMMEAQVDYIIKVMKYMEKENLQIIEPTEQAQQNYVDKMEKDTQGTVWTSGGCDSWYIDKTKRNSILWPSFTFSFSRLLSKLKPTDYHGRRVDSHIDEQQAK